MLGWVARQLRSEGYDPCVSPDGSQIAFVAGHYRELWLMGANGEEAHRVLSVDRTTDWLVRPLWSPDGERIAFFHGHETRDSAVSSIECLDVTGGRRTILLTDPRLWQWSWGVWTPDGRIVYVRADSSDLSGSWNLWQVKVDARHGRISGKPRRITNWTDARCLPSSVSADSRRLVYYKAHIQSDVYVARFSERGTISGTPQRLTLNDRDDDIAGWTADGGAILFISDRGGTPRLFRQRINQSTAEQLVAAPGWDLWCWGGRTSPDGAQLFYWKTTREGRTAQGPSELMRVPVTGGPPERVLVSARPAELRCGSRPEDTCVVGEMAGDTLVVSRVGPAGGRGEEVARIRVRAVSEWDWSLSPDGSRIALVEPRQDTIRVLDVRSHEVSTVVLRNANEIWAAGKIVRISWAPSGREFFLTGGGGLFCVDLAGEAREVYRGGDYLFAPVPSPDGRHIAFTQENIELNEWLLERF